MHDPPHDVEPAVEPAQDRTWFAVAAAGVLLALLLPFNAHWTPGGDSDFYTSLARNLARGDGYLYNGLKPAISPPGWPYALAGLMRISPSFLWLNAAQSLLLWAGLVLFYPIARHMAGPRLAALATITTALLHPVYPLGSWLHSEPLYLVAANAAVLAALLYAAGGRAKHAWLAAAVTLGVLAVVVRWTGLFHWLVAAAALVALRPHAATTTAAWARRLGPSLAGSLIVGLSFWGLWTAMNVTTEVAQQTFVDESQPGRTTQDILANATNPPPGFEGATPSLEEDPPAGEPPPTSQPAGTTPLAYDPQVTQEALGHGNFFGGAIGEYARRLANGGSWASWMLWYPSRFASGLPGAAVAVALAGWAALGLFAIGAWRMPPAGRWLAAGTLAYLATLALMWPNPNARYLVPIAPLLIVGVLLGARRLGARLPWAIAATMLAANLPLYAVDVYLARVPGAAAEHYEAGAVAPLVAGAQYVRSTGAGDGETVVSERYINFGRVRRLRTGARAAELILNADLQMMPMAVPDEPWDPGLARHLAKYGVRWYLYQEPAEPWRLWHFRVPRRLQAMLSGVPVGDESGGWQLYRVVPRKGERAAYLSRVDLPIDPDTFEWPDRVPGL